MDEDTITKEKHPLDRPVTMHDLRDMSEGVNRRLAAVENSSYIYRRKFDKYESWGILIATLIVVYLVGRFLLPGGNSDE